MSIRLIEKITHCPECKLKKLKLHVCRKCQVVIFSTVLTRTARCPECHQWLNLEKEVKVRGLPGYSEYYIVSRRSDFDFICDSFTRHRGNVLKTLEQRRQLTLTGLERS